MMLDLGNDEYLVAGTGVVMTMENASEDGTIIGTIDELNARDGEIVKGRRMNGDQDHQGRHLRIPFDSYGAQILKIYRYK